MCRIELPVDDFATVSDVSQVLVAIKQWHSDMEIKPWGTHTRAWFRGHSKRSYNLEPGVYRDAFTKQLGQVSGADEEESRLELERQMLQEFRSLSASELNPDRIVHLYFTAQHYGMPTRLLDWTSNPLAALFFACKSHPSEDGEVVLMQPSQILPTPATDADAGKYVHSMRHPFVEDAIGQMFWEKPVIPRKPVILPLRPDTVAGRISKQSSLFTLHMHKASSVTNPTLVRVKVNAKAKPEILIELRRLNINQYTVYNDLDHLSKEIRMNWGLA